MADTYEGSCHCGAVRYTVDLELGEVNSCNCTLCRRVGWLLTFVPEDAFQLHTGEDAVTDYQFNKMALHHPFCRTCGVRAYSFGDGPDGKKMYAVNTRCLEGVEARDLPVKMVDGAST